MTAASLFASGESLTGDQAIVEEPMDQPTPRSASFSGATSLYRKYRPSSFGADELVGQDHVVRTLRNAIALGRVAHAYLFSGPRGTGKTTTARLLAKAVNCLDADPARRPCNACQNCLAINAGSSPDIIEIDAASNRGIDDIRDLRERIRYAPAQLPSKVYIIDEAHQITGAAANAFLKTLEEPPDHSRFILATTDPEELLPTIVSRCQRFEFRRIGADDMARRLRTVADLEGFAVTDDALRVIARHATGSLRDALGLLEQLALLSDPASSSGEPLIAAIDVIDVAAALGLSRNDRVEALAEAIVQRSAGDALRIVQEAIDEGDDPRQLNRQLLGYLRLLLLERSGSASEADDHARALAARFSLDELARLTRGFSEIDFSIKHAPYPQLPLELALVEATLGDQTPAAIAPGRPSSTQDQQTHNQSPRPTSLRDRVRTPTAIREEPPRTPSPAPVPSDPAPVTPLRPARGPESGSQPAPARSGTVSDEVGQIAEMWPRVRADVKALNRRMEALLSEVDPVAVNEKQITLAVPYPFHRDKLNSDEVRETVSSVLSRLVGRELSIVCILRGEMAGATTVPAVGAAEVPVPQPAGNEGTEDDTARDSARLRAAMNIFDAEEIEVSEARPAPNDATGG